MIKRKIIVSIICCMCSLNAFCQSILVDCEIIPDKDYEEFTRKASEIGATHLHCIAVEPSMWQWNPDRYDPYPNWSVLRPTVFKLYVPDALKKYIPADYAKKNLANLKKRVEILKKYNLKPVYSGFDPAYLPEAVYVDHPEWRGSRCDQSRRSRKAYYAPCVDNPEMRALFVNAVENICKEVPFEHFDVMVNDSGSGLCWYPHLYPGSNGPQACRDIPVETRIVNFLSIFQEGAAAAGVKNPQVNLARYLSASITSSTIPHLKEGQSVLNRNSKGTESYTVIGFPNFYDTFFPVCQMPRIACIAKQTQAAQAKNAKNLEIGLRGVKETDAFRFLGRYLKEPVGPKASDLAKSLEWLATTFVGEQGRDALVDVWNDIEKIEAMFAPYQTGGHMFRLGTVHQRWLTRPFVVFPEKLTKEEKSYWREFIFQAGTEEEAMDMTNLQAHKWLGGYGGYFQLMKTCTFARPVIKKNIDVLTRLEKLAVDEESAEYIHGFNLRLQFFRIIMENAIHAVEFQYFIDEYKQYGAEGGDRTMLIQFQGESKYPELDQLVRDEVDNCVALIKLIDRAEKDGIQIAVTCESPQTENIMLLSPTLKSDLQKKIQIMRKYRGDIDQILKSPNH